MTTEESWRKLGEIWGNTEEILYIISNKDGEIPRDGIVNFSKPFSSVLENMISNDTVDLHEEGDIKEKFKEVQEDRYFGINFKNIGATHKDTIEFRLANGTIDEGTWIENINLFGGIVRTAEDLAIIQSKSEKERTEKEQKMLEYFEQVKAPEISKQEKLEALLTIVIPEKDRDIYRKRYEINSQLIEQKPKIKKKIASGVAKSSISLNKIGKKIFLEEDPVTGQDYKEGAKIIEKDLRKRTRRDNQNISLEREKKTNAKKNNYNRK